jgi:hypothetical protein
MLPPPAVGTYASGMVAAFSATADGSGRPLASTVSAGAVISVTDWAVAAG